MLYNNKINKRGSVVSLVLPNFDNVSLEESELNSGLLSHLSISDSEVGFIPSVLSLSVEGGSVGQLVQ